MEARRLRKALNDRVGVMATASEARRDSPRESVGLEVLVEKVLDLRRPGMGRSNTLTESELSLINSPEKPSGSSTKLSPLPSRRRLLGVFKMKAGLSGKVKLRPCPLGSSLLGPCSGSGEKMEFSSVPEGMARGNGRSRSPGVEAPEVEC